MAELLSSHNNHPHEAVALDTVCYPYYTVLKYMGIQTTFVITCACIEKRENKMLYIRHKSDEL